MIIEKGKTLNGYAISVLFMKNNADLWLSGRYFFMEITKSNRTIIKQIMYSLSIAVTSFLGDDGITAQLLHCFKSYLIGLLRLRHYILFTYTFQVKSTKNVDNVKTDKPINRLVCFSFNTFSNHNTLLSNRCQVLYCSFPAKYRLNHFQS